MIAEKQIKDQFKGDEEPLLTHRTGIKTTESLPRLEIHLKGDKKYRKQLKRCLNGSDAAQFDNDVFRT